jgi:hypothetical protein
VHPLTGRMLALPDEPTAENGMLEGEDWRVDVMNSFKQTPSTESELAAVAAVDEHVGNAADAVVKTADS